MARFSYLLEPEKPQQKANKYTHLIAPDRESESGGKSVKIVESPASKLLREQAKFSPEHVGGGFIGAIIPDIIKPKFIAKKQAQAEGTLGGAVGTLAGDIVPIAVGYGVASKIPLLKKLITSGKVLTRTGGRIVRAGVAASIYDAYKGRYDPMEIAKDAALFAVFDAGSGGVGDVVKYSKKVLRDLKALDIPEFKAINEIEYNKKIREAVDTLTNENISLRSEGAQIYTNLVINKVPDEEAIPIAKKFKDNPPKSYEELGQSLENLGFSKDEITQQQKLWEEVDALNQEHPIAGSSTDTLLGGGYSANDAERISNTLTAKSQRPDADFWAGIDDSLTDLTEKELIRPVKESVEKSRRTGAVPRGIANLLNVTKVTPQTQKFSKETTDFVSKLDSSYVGGGMKQPGVIKRLWDEFRKKGWFGQKAIRDIRADKEAYPMFNDTTLSKTFNETAVAYNRMLQARSEIPDKVKRFEEIISNHVVDIKDDFDHVLHPSDEILVDGLRLTSTKALHARLKHWPQEIYEAPYIYTELELKAIRNIQKRLSGMDEPPLTMIKKLRDIKANAINRLEWHIAEMESVMHEQAKKVSDELFAFGYAYGLENEANGILSEGTVATHPYWMPFDILKYTAKEKDPLLRKSLRVLTLGHTREAVGSTHPINTNWIEAMRNYIYDSELAKAQIQFERGSYSPFHNPEMDGVVGWTKVYTRPQAYSNVVARHVEAQRQELMDFYTNLANESIDENTRKIILDTANEELKYLAPMVEEFVVPTPIAEYVKEYSAPYLAADAHFKRAIADVTMFAKRNMTYRLHLAMLKFHLQNGIGDILNVSTLYDNASRAMTSVPWALDAVTRDFGSAKYINKLNDGIASYLKSKGLDSIGNQVGKRFVGDALDDMIYKEVQRNGILQGGRFVNEAISPGIRFLEPAKRKGGVLDLATIQGLPKRKRLEALGVAPSTVRHKIATGTDIALNEIDKVLVARENVLRVALYRDMRRHGLTEAEALSTIDRVLIDYQRKTPIERWWANSLTPFLSFKKGSITNDLVALMPAIKRNDAGRVAGIATRRGLSVAIKTLTLGYMAEVGMRAYNEHFYPEVEEELYKKDKNWVTSVPHIVTDYVTEGGGRLIIGLGMPSSELTDFFGLHEFFHRMMKRSVDDKVHPITNLVDAAPDTWDILRRAMLSNIKELAGPAIKIPFGIMTYKDLYTGYPWAQENDKWLPWVDYSGDDIVGAFEEFKRNPSSARAGKLLKIFRFLDYNLERNMKQLEQVTMTENTPLLKQMKFVVPNLYILYPSGTPKDLIPKSEWGKFLQNFFNYTYPSEQSKPIESNSIGLSWTQRGSK